MVWVIRIGPFTRFRSTTLRKAPCIISEKPLCEKAVCNRDMPRIFSVCEAAAAAARLHRGRRAFARDSRCFEFVQEILKNAHLSCEPGISTVATVGGFLFLSVSKCQKKCQ